MKKFKENLPRILLFLVLWLVLGLGIHRLLSLISDSTLLGIYQFVSSDITLDENEVKFSISCWVSLGLNALFFYLKWGKVKPPPINQKEMKPGRLEEDERFSKIAEQIAERHNKYGVTLTNPETGEDLLAGMTNEQRENYRQFKIKTSRIRQEEKERGNK